MIQPVCCLDGISVLLFADSDAIQLDGRPWFLQNGEFVVSCAVGPRWKSAHAKERCEEAGKVRTLRPLYRGM